MFSYQYGFIKRGLIGTMVHPLLRFWSFDQLKPAIVVAHVIACCSIIVALQVLFQGAVRRSRQRDARMVLALSFLCVMCSPLMPVLAHDSGYVDVYLITVVLASLWLVVRRQYLAAGVIGAVGPLIHEGFVFLWAPLAIMLAWSSVVAEADRAKKILAAALPLLSMAIVIWLHDSRAIDLLMNTWRVADDVKSGHIVFTFGQTLQSSFAHMKRYEFQGHWANFFIALVYSMVPGLLLLWAAVFCYWQRWAARWTTVGVAVLATLSPLPVVTLGWDLSRFLSWSILAAAIVLISVGAPELVAMVPDEI